MGAEAAAALAGVAAQAIAATDAAAVTATPAFLVRLFAFAGSFHPTMSTTPRFFG
ncbi:hypothetical protein JQK87_02705 [Streptomyces sp. G44]|uniref:hypothetical protein n=1 Tax=Streptomyces sp. G44 TaxID=2807632 RepID=UPI001961C6F5|nr:hypothetical protein [Streptomyces sp. G44]MBM7167346.1 hypothetical protein [Streptomyces sp. G44]